MDYYHNTSNSDTKSTQPNAHDFEELGIIYAHLDSTNTVDQTIKSLPAPAVARGDLNDPSEWGKKIRDDAREALYELDLGNGNKVFTFVTYAR